ncbi:MAG: sulfite reductase subunit alpha, partial [Planctomycetota bacterium]
MSVPEVPESAPFTEEQRVWLNGFLAAWAGIEQRAGRSLPSEISDISEAPATAGFIGVNGAAAAGSGAVGSTATAVADPPATASDEEDDPFDGEYPWHDSGMDLDDRLKLADEQPAKFKLMAAMAQLDCGACGYMCDTYAFAIAKGEEKNLLLCSPGGKDTAKALKQIVRDEKKAGGAGGAAAQTAKPGREVGDEPEAELFSRQRPIRAKVMASRNLNKTGSEKHTQHVELSLAHDDVAYEVGDSLGVLPMNDERLVERILETLRSHGTEPVVSPDGVEEPLRECLHQRANLSQISDELVELVLASTGDADEKRALNDLLDDDDRMTDTDLLELLELAPTASIPSRKLARTLSPLVPRLYSIASSLRANPCMVHLTVARVAYEVRGRTRLGVASTMLTDRLPVGDTVIVYRHEGHDFSLPEDGDTPIIMVGPGTGVAPFRAFLQEREATGAKGKNWLFFGDQHEKTDFLYSDEFASMQESGLLTRLTTAFSRDQDEKVYVQHRMAEESA